MMRAARRSMWPAGATLYSHRCWLLRRPRGPGARDTAAAGSQAGPEQEPPATRQSATATASMGMALAHASGMGLLATACAQGSRRRRRRSSS